MKKFFSIIIPMYNSEKYIYRCLNSIMNQTYKNLEIIIINDGSIDNSLKICKEISKNDDRIKIINKDNGGVSKARNDGIDTANGEYILFVDSDDWLEINTIEILNNILNEKDVDLIIFNINKILKKQYINNEKDLLNCLSKLMVTEKINSPGNKLYKKSILTQNEVRFVDNIGIAEDLLFNLEYYDNINTLYICEKILYQIDTSNNESLSRKYNKNKYVQLMDVNERIKKLFYKYNNKKLNEACRYIKFKNIISCCLDLFDKRCSYQEKEKIKLMKKYKKDNGRMLITGISIKMCILSIIYSILPTSLLFYIIKSFKIRRK